MLKQLKNLVIAKNQSLRTVYCSFGCAGFQITHHMGAVYRKHLFSRSVAQKGGCVD